MAKRCPKMLKNRREYAGCLMQSDYINWGSDTFNDIV